MAKDYTYRYPTVLMPSPAGLVIDPAPIVAPVPRMELLSCPVCGHQLGVPWRSGTTHRAVLSDEAAIACGTCKRRLYVEGAYYRGDLGLPDAIFTMGLPRRIEPAPPLTMPPGGWGEDAGSNACGHPYCDDVPDAPGPCDHYEPCTCDWPPCHYSEHCATCQHQEDCHRRKEAQA